MKRIQSTLSRALGRGRQASSTQRRSRLVVLSLAVFLCSFLIAVPTVFVAGQKMAPAPPTGQRPTPPRFGFYSKQAVAFAETPALRDVKPEPLTPAEMEKFKKDKEDREKNPSNVKRVKGAGGSKITAPVIDRAINNFKHKDSGINAVTNPLQNFDGPDADLLPGLFGSRFAPPDTNAAVGPNHVVITVNSMVQVFSKTGVAAGPAVRISTLLAGLPGAADDDGDPIVLYDQLADRWLISQFRLTLTGNSTHEHIAISKTGDPSGQYFAYDFLLTPGRVGDYPKLGVWPDGYYMSTNDFNTSFTAFLGAGLYAFERNKMLVGDPTAKIIGFNTTNVHGGLLPSNLEGYTIPPAGTPNTFVEFDADEFGAPFDLIRGFIFDVDFAVPANSTLTQGPDVATAAFDARQPASRANIAQPAPGEGLDSIADRLMHPMNFRVLPGGVQSLVLNFSVNVSGVNPANAATYQTGVRWMELRRNAGTGALTINQQATYAPGSGNPTGRDLWMASVAQDGEGNIALAANASNSTATPAILNPTAIYTGRLAGDPANTLPQGEVDAFSAVTKGVQTATFNRWGDYSSLFVDPVDDCTFWAAFEYVDSPTASFDWNTRMFSFKVNGACVSAPKGTISGTVTNCNTGLPIPNALVTTPDGFVRQTDANGQYSITAAPGTYTVVITAPGGFSTCTTNNVVVTNGGNTVVNCCLGPSAIIVSAGATLLFESCTPANGALDPNEQVTISFCIQNTGGANTTSSLVGTLANTGGVTGGSGPQNYGIVTAGGAAVCRNFSFIVNGTCGGTVTASIQFQDGATNLGTVTYTFTLGVLATAFSENFDGVTAPALPAGWAATQGTNVTGAPLWVTSTTTPDTAPNDAFSTAPSNILDNRLDTPGIAITSASSQLSFRNNYDLQDVGTGFDGAALEISSPNINAGAFTDIITAGGSFVSGGYNGIISNSFGNPIGGRMAWTGTSTGYITTLVNLPAAVNGQTIIVRFREGSDDSFSSVGWRVDTIRITSGFVCSTTCPPPTCTGITCPGNITVSNDPDMCGAVVTYADPTPVGAGCGTITCTPSSGSFFAAGTTTVNCSSTPGPSCSFTVTVNDTQPPAITCPPNQTVVTDQNQCPSPPCLVANFPAPVATDNCPGVTVVCNPPSGSCFPTGVTTVTCTATDTSSNTATCSFTVSVFDTLIQDDSDPNNSLVWNSLTGAYRFCCNGTIYTGVGKSTIQGCVYTLQHAPADRRVLGRVDKAVHSGSGSIQAPPGFTRCTITDRNTLDDTQVCGAAPLPGRPGIKK